jgi:GntR family transcriptional regulator/MocR family aminotransferase
MQAVLAEFLSGGYLTAYLRAARQHYVIRRDALVHAIARAWGGRVRLGPFDTGLHLVAHLPQGSDDVGLTHLLPDGGGMTLGALSRQYAGNPRSPGLLLGYGGAPEATIERVVATLAPAIRSL